MQVGEGERSIWEGALERGSQKGKVTQICWEGSRMLGVVNFTRKSWLGRPTTFDNGSISALSISSGVSVSISVLNMTDFKKSVLLVNAV